MKSSEEKARLEGKFEMTAFLHANVHFKALSRVDLMVQIPLFLSPQAGPNTPTEA